MLASSSAGARAAFGILRGYRTKPGVRDEMMTEAGEVRPHWRRFLESLAALGPDVLARRWETARQLIHENGVSYNVYGDPQGMERPWSLSPVPVLLAHEEWAEVSRGLAQRARLLDALLADLYGAQRVLLDGFLPAALVHAHPGFLRPCHGVPIEAGRWLPLYGADLVRAPDGRFVVLADRTQAPSGPGYALENRIVISRTLPDVFRDSGIERLALFFRGLQQTLAAMAPHNRDNPRVVLLTPGPYNATYFEQAYLAQYLGYTLVNGGDLTVRDDRVFLKTLGGLQPVDVILRRVNDGFCDPLELRQDSVLGVPGLVEAVRRGHVALANPLGSGVLQTPAILPYLPRLCRHLLGEDLLLPSVRAWWCGDDEARREAMARLTGADKGPSVVVKPAFPEGFVHPVFVSRLDASAREALRARIAASPTDFVIEEELAASTTPVLEGGVLEPRALVLRAYAVTRGEDWTVMPGALSRVAGANGGPEISMQTGAGSEDTWVLAGGPVSAFSLLPPPSHPLPLSRGGGDLPSRAADNLYWLGRYAERAEALARLARVLVARLSDPSIQGEPAEEVTTLFQAMASQTDFAPVVVPASTRSPTAALERQLVAAILDGERSGSLAAAVRSTVRVARMVRDRLSMDTWRVLATLDDELRLPVPELSTNSAAALGPLLNRVVITLAAFSGLAIESMTRGQAWRFLDLGRRLERAAGIVGLLRATLVRRADREGPLLEAVLEVADSGMTYRRRYLAAMQVAPVVDLLLTDETNPRAAAFQLAALADHLAALPAVGAPGVRSPQERIAIGALAELRLAEVERLCVPDAMGDRPNLEELLARLHGQLPALSDTLSGSYLNHAVLSRHLGGASGGYFGEDA